ncbi:T6SS effector BTH_I2691 family protein [Halomonas sp. V046]|uniref:T6SS effector BTH_I2691 family protein n=1 Tax=Halomonas sp. V046 TaxID=3459611 RepID=UPI004043CC65
MSEEPNKSIGDCPFCQKGGLPILPLRYAVTRTDSGSSAPQGPALSAPFGAGVADIALPEGQAYTLRLARGGYLYVFNEVRGSWSGYVVTERGFLFPYVTEVKQSVLARIDPNNVQEGIDALLQPPANETEFSCASNPDHHYPGRCITIPDADQADNIYLAFSDTAWTKRVWHEHATNVPIEGTEIRRRDHMRKVSLAEWRGGSADHAAAMSELESRVAESHYQWSPLSQCSVSGAAEGEIAPSSPFGHSRVDLNGLLGHTGGLMQWADEQVEPLSAPAMMIAVDDPVGVAADLADLMRVRLQEFMNQDDWQRPLAISALIDSLQEAIRNQAEVSTIRAEQQKAVDRVTPGHGMLARDGGLDLRNHHARQLENNNDYRRRWEQRLKDAKQEAVDGLSGEDLDTAADDAWEKYESKLEDGQPRQWRENVYQRALAEYDQNHLVPLARAHQAWLRGEAMFRSFACNHDDADAESGVGYIQALLLCIQDTQENQICFDNYQAWLEASTADGTNLLQRALVHNQQSVLDAFTGVDTSSPDIPYDKWASLIGLYNSSLKHLESDGKNLVAQLVVAVGGPIMLILNKVIDTGLERLVVFLGVIGGSPIKMVRHTGTVSDALDAMVNMMKKLNPEALGDVDAQLLKRRLEIRSRGQRREVALGRNSQGQPVQQVRMRVDRLALIDIEGELGDRQSINRAANALLEMDEWPTNQVARYKAIFDTNARLAVVGLIFQVFSSYQLTKKLDDSMDHKRTENNWRNFSSWGAVVAGVGNIMHDGIEKGAGSGYRRLAELANKSWVKRFGGFSRALGFGAAVIMSAFDVYHTVRELRSGNVGMAGLYLTSAFSGVGAALLLGGYLGAGFTTFGIFLSATGIGVVLVLVGIGIALLIGFLENDAIQEWMNRCAFGKLKNERYGELGIELSQFEMAMKEMGVDASNRGQIETSPCLVLGG